MSFHPAPRTSREVCRIPSLRLSMLRVCVLIRIGVSVVLVDLDAVYLRLVMRSVSARRGNIAVDRAVRLTCESGWLSPWGDEERSAALVGMERWPVSILAQLVVCSQVEVLLPVLVVR